MRWYKDLYKGPEAAKKVMTFKTSVKYLMKLNHGYLIILAHNPRNLLEIVPVRELSGPLADMREYDIVGIAIGRGEAFELVRTMVADVYERYHSLDFGTLFTEFVDEHPRNRSKSWLFSWKQKKEGK